MEDKYKDESVSRGKQEDRRKKRKEDSARRPRKDKENNKAAVDDCPKHKLLQTAEVGLNIRALCERDKELNKTAQDIFAAKNRRSKSKSREQRREKKSIKAEGGCRPTTHREREEDRSFVLSRTGKLEMLRDEERKKRCSVEKNQTAKIDLRGILRDEEGCHQQYLGMGPVRQDLTKRVAFLVEEQGKDKLLMSYCQFFDEDEPFEGPRDKTQAFKESFLVGKQIGEGAYASVRVALHRSTNTKVAIKIYEKAKIRETQRKRSVLREIKIMQMAQHPNVVRILDAVETNNHVNIVMQHVQGRSLQQYLKARQGRVEELEAKAIVLQLLKALSYLHSINVVHRDVKLQNILLENDSVPVLIDFGFSTCVPAHLCLRLFCGTPSYMAPEIVNKEEYAGPPTDVWALGVVLWVMLVGHFPFKGATDKQLYARINQGVTRTQGEDAHQVPSGLSRLASDLLEKMLHTNADRRPSAGQLIQHPWFREVKASPQYEGRAEECA